MTTHRLQTRRTTRLVSSGELTHDTRLIIIGCHGYGMDVEAFATSFGQMPAGVALLCPEGLSRFYWGGFTGKPVASWMTSLERDSEIEDFCDWLDRVLVLAQAGAPRARIYALGFSQGAATVVRWAQRSRPALAGIVLWAGTPPEDIVYEPRAYFEGLRRIAYWGDGDELVPREQADRRFAEVPITFERREFRGGHDIVGESFSRLLVELVGGESEERAPTRLSLDD